MSLSHAEISKTVIDYLAVRYQGGVIDENTRFSNLGIDSVEAAALIAHISGEHGLSLPATLIWQCETIRDVSDVVVDYMKGGDSYNAVPGFLTSDLEHPYAQHVNPVIANKLASLNMAISFVKAKDHEIWDTEGNRYVDFMSQYGALPFGHNPGFCWEAMTRVMNDDEPNFCQPSLSNTAGSLAKRLCDLAPMDAQYCVFTNSGTETVEAALKIARSFTGRAGVLSAIRGFHGKTIAALAATGNARYQAPYNLSLEEYDHIPYDDVDALAAQLEANPEKYAAFIIEPIQGEGGIRTPDSSYLQRCKALCERHDVLFIVDEIQTGLGRTGRLFCCAPEVNPDMLLTAKALGGGLVPIGACLVKPEFYTLAFAETHSSTFAGGSVACRVGSRVLDKLTEQNGQLLSHVTNLGAKLKAALNRLHTQYPHIISRVDGEGFMLGVEFQLAPHAWGNSLFRVASEQNLLTQFIAAYLLNVEGIRVAPTLNSGSVLRLQPPLTISEEACNGVMDAFARCIKHINSGDLGSFYLSILQGKPLGYQEFRSEAISEPGVTVSPVQFGFLMHPLDSKSFVDFDPSLAALSAEQLDDFVETIQGSLDPFILKTVTVHDSQGRNIRGDFISLGYTTSALQKLPKPFLMDHITKALDIAKARNARIVGLGAYSSILTGSGELIANQGIPLTSGNSFTVVSGIKTVESIVNLRGQDLSGKTVAIIGAAGAIGSALAVELAPRVSRLILIGNPNNTEAANRSKFDQVANRIISHASKPQTAAVKNSIGHYVKQEGALDCAEIRDFLYDEGLIVTTSCMTTLKYADIILAATSSTGNVCAPADLKDGAIVCDLSRPRSFDAEFIGQRHDVTFIDGGEITIPDQPDLDLPGLGKGKVFACMAETMLLSLNDRFQHTSLGPHISSEDVALLSAYSEAAGFEVRDFTCMNIPLSNQSLLKNIA